MKTPKYLALTALFAAGPALAADTAPDLGKAQKELQCLVGSWKGTGSLKTPDGATTTVQVAWECKSAAGGFGVSCHGRMTGIPGMKSYEEDDLFGFNAGDGLYHWYSITNAGETHDHKGGLANNAFVGLYAGPQEGQLFQEQVTLAFDGEKKIKLRSSSTLGGQDQGTIEGVLTK